jgi:hypothetical protein
VKRNEKRIASLAPIVWRTKVKPVDDKEDEADRKEVTVQVLQTA